MRTLFNVAAFFSLVVWLSAAGVLAELTTLDGKTYKQVKVVKVLPVEIRIMHADGFATIPLSMLPPEIRANYGTADVNAEAAAAEQRRLANMAAAAQVRQDREAQQFAQLTQQPLAICRQAVVVRDWCLANPAGGSLMGVVLDQAGRDEQLVLAMNILNARPASAPPAPPPAAMPPAGGVPPATAPPAGGAVPPPTVVPANGFQAGEIELISARYTLQNDQPRNVKNRLAKLIPKGVITAPVTIQVSDALSDAALDEGNVTRGAAVAVTTTKNGVTAGVAEVVVQPPQPNMLTVEYLYNGQRFKKQALEGTVLVLP